MPRLRVGHSVQQLSVRTDSHADPGSHRHINAVLQSLGNSVGGFAQRSRIHIRVKAHGTVQRLLKGAHNVIILPSLFGCGGDIAVIRHPLDGVDGAEAADPQRLDPLLLKKVDHLRHGLLRRPGGKAYPSLNLSMLVSYGADHFGAACLQCSDPHLFTCSFPLMFLLFLYHARRKMSSVKLIVSAARCDQPVVASPLYDAALLHDHDAVCVADGGKPVRNDKQCFSLYKPRERGLNDRLVFRIGVGGRLV